MAGGDDVGGVMVKNMQTLREFIEQVYRTQDFIRDWGSETPQTCRDALGDKITAACSVMRIGCGAPVINAAGFVAADSNGEANYLVVARASLPNLPSGYFELRRLRQRDASGVAAASLDPYEVTNVSIWSPDTLTWHSKTDRYALNLPHFFDQDTLVALRGWVLSTGTGIDDIAYLDRIIAVFSSKHITL